MRSPLQSNFYVHRLDYKNQIFYLVPSARLELAQLSPLPPQDSVSPNFTPTAVIYLDGLRNLSALLLSRLP